MKRRVAALALVLAVFFISGCVVVTDVSTYRYYFYNESSSYIHIESSEGDFYLYPRRSYSLESPRSTIFYEATVIGASGSVRSEKHGNSIYFYNNYW
jgi:hypothetical protein